MGLILKYSDLLKTYKTRGHRTNRLKDHKNLFPIYANPALAGIIADLIGDGSLQSGNIWKIDFISKSKKELRRFNKEINVLFGAKGNIRRCSSNIFGKTYIISICNAPVTRILYLCGTPSGAKVLQKFDIPNWIKEDKECFRRFAQRLFTCEGSIMYEKNRRLPQVRMGMWKSEKYLKQNKEFMQDIADHLEKYFGINSVVRNVNIFNTRKDGIITRPIVMYITGDSVIRFAKEVGFEGEKQERLSKLLG